MNDLNVRLASLHNNLLTLRTQEQGFSRLTGSLHDNLLRRNLLCHHLGLGRCQHLLP